MTSTEIKTQASAAGGAHKRRLKNVLLNRRFQIKFTMYVMLLTMVVSLAVGAFLLRTTRKLYAEAEVAVDARSKAAEKSKELGKAILANELLLRMHDPSFKEQLTLKSDAIDRDFELEKEASILARSQLVETQRKTLVGLVLGLLAFIAFVGLAGIYTTHRIVGPLFRLNRLCGEVAEGKLPPPPHGFRSHDELKDTIDVFTHMLSCLRSQKENELKNVAQAIDLAAQSASHELLMSALKDLETKMKASLE